MNLMTDDPTMTARIHGDHRLNNKQYKTESAEAAMLLPACSSSV
jgi:hypothetical protein